MATCGREGEGMKNQRIKIFKIKNRKGYAAICCHHLTEGKTAAQAAERMEKALRRRKKTQ
ncbi:MAG: hypothetical protein PHH75_07985 [Candidatus Omnitrophica bacterium]|nr:hypothetical protein [Candidatus Omnitrophota bacterium]MDD5575098.1 hypothetical protein [Candidatus Omnitrophota bacterium]